MRLTALATFFVLLVLTTAAVAQRDLFFGRNLPTHRVPYDGRFTFVRIKYTGAPGGYAFGGRPSWLHGYPLAEQNLMRILKEVSWLDAHTDEISVLGLDDPDLFRYPIAYIIEVGWWTLTDREAEGLRAYLKRGGLLIVDDFKVEGWRGLPGGGWNPFEANMKRVLPEGQFLEMDLTDPIFHSFFDIKSLDNFPQAYTSGPPIFRGLYEDNDPNKRLMVMVNYNTDVSQYWEWSGRGFRPFDDTNEAYKLGVNWMIYGMTH